MKQDIVVRSSPFVFLKRVVIIEFFFALLPFVLAALLNLQRNYESSTLSDTVSYPVLLTIVVTTLQVLIIAIAFTSWYLPVYQIDGRQIVYQRGSLFADRKLVDTQSIMRIERHQGRIGRRLNYGTLAISSSDNTEKAHIKNIPDPAYYVELIQHLVDPELALPSAFEPKPVPELIAGGENQHVEFKSSLIWYYRRQVANKDLYEPVMKNLAAFLNARGGALLIGVGDAGEILGLEPDLKTLRKPNVDGIENVLNMAFNKMIGVEFRQYVDVTFPGIDGKTICAVTVRPSTEPAYLVFKGTEKFYIRAGNGTQPLSVSKATKYIQARFV